MIEEIRSFDKEAAMRTIHHLEKAVHESILEHGHDQFCKNRVARIKVIKNQLKRKVNG